jgi:hypothetical protein
MGRDNSFTRVALPDGLNLFSQIDGDRAPRDATPAANASQRTKLVDPGSQFVCQPLSIAGLG